MAKKTTKAKKAPAKKSPAASKRKAAVAKRSAAARPAKKASAAKRSAAARKSPAAKKSSAKKPLARTAVAKAKPASKKARSAAKRKPAPAAARTQAARGKAPALAKAHGVRRRDGAGHIDPQYAHELLEKSGNKPDVDEGHGFVDRPRSKDDLSEELGEEFVVQATSAEHEGEDILDQDVPEDRGGPFVETTAKEEFGYGTDLSNPKGAKREPFPTT